MNWIIKQYISHSQHVHIIKKKKECIKGQENKNFKTLSGTFEYLLNVLHGLILCKL